MSTGKGDAPDFGKGEGQENLERMVNLARGPKGEPGAQGGRGERGLSQLQGKAVVVLFLIAAALGVANLFWTSHEVHAAQAAQASEQTAQRQQGAVLEEKLCATLGKLAALRPPPGDPASNPSRAFDQTLHATLAQLSPDLGCKP